jgi:hypothetical protein
LNFFRSDPFSKNPNVKRLKNEKLSRGFRLRLGDYRLVYRVPSDSNKVILVSIGQRGEICRKPPGKSSILGSITKLIPERWVPPAEIPSETKPVPSVSEPEVATYMSESQPFIEEFLFDADELDLIRIPAEYHEQILAANSMHELDGSGLPHGVLTRLSDYLTNPSQIHIGRLYTLESEDDFTAVAEQPLRDFMLAPDPQQRTVIDKDLNGGPLGKGNWSWLGCAPAASMKWI